LLFFDVQSDQILDRRARPDFRHDLKKRSENLTATDR